MEQKMIRADFHLHTQYSKDSLTDIRRLYARSKELGFGKLIITDHNTIEGTQLLHAEHPDDVIVGEEILTTSGEILALFVSEKIPVGLEPEEAFRRLKDQGAFISLSHPYAMMRHGWTEEEMLRFYDYLDAIEVANARNTHEMNLSAQRFAAEHGLMGTAGSDAHHIREFGRMGLELPDFHDAESLRQAIRSARVFGLESSAMVHFFSREAVAVKKIRKIFHFGKIDRE